MPDVGTFVNNTYGYSNAYTGQTVTTNEMSPGMKTYYDTEMLENMREKLVFAQFAKKYHLPANHGMTMEWRKWKTMPNIERLQEGVIPPGRPFGQTATTASIAQHGAYVTISEQLDLKHIDDVIVGAQSELSHAAARTMDTIHRDGVLAGATNVLYADLIQKDNGEKDPNLPAITATHELVADIARYCPLTPEIIARAKTIMEGNNVPKINGKWYVAVINPYAAFDLMRNTEWTDYHKYSATEEIFNGEIGELYGIRFVQTTQAPVMVGDPLYSQAQRYLTVTGYTNLSTPGSIANGNGYGVGSLYAFTVSENLANAEVNYEDLIGQYILHYENDVLTRMIVSGVDTANKKIYTEPGLDIIGGGTVGGFLNPGNGGMEAKLLNSPVAVFGTMFFGQDAYGIIDPDGGSIQMIIKGKGEIGGPLEQFSTVGTKFETGTKILYPERCLVVYHTGEYSNTVPGNWRM